MNSKFVNRIIRACKLDVSLYEEVEADKSATFQAALVVVLSSLAAGPFSHQGYCRLGKAMMSG